MLTLLRLSSRLLTRNSLTLLHILDATVAIGMVFSEEEEEVMASMEEGMEEEAKGKEEEKVKGGDVEAGSEVWAFAVQIVMLGVMGRVMPVRSGQKEQGEGEERRKEEVKGEIETE